MGRKLVKMTPDQLGYKDRGKMKWQGLMLSDHTDALRRIEKENVYIEPSTKDKMSEVEISKVLQLAYINKVPIVMQANILTNGHYFQDLKCIVLGYADDKIYLKLLDGRHASCELYQIKNIEYMDSLEWYGKK